MPGRKGAAAVAGNIREFHKGKTYKRTKAKHGKKVADKQAVAVGFSEAGLARKKRKAKKKKRSNRAETEM